MNKVYVIGMGPGAYEQMTVKAIRTLEKCDVIVGYTVYIELLKEHFPDKRYLTTSMRQEAERCRMAFEEAKKGAVTAMVCSGDAGIYGMAGLMYEVLEEKELSDCIELEIVAGVTAANAGAAYLGAPLMHDFALISLSDLMTPWEVIARRLQACAQADMGIVLYNPSSHKRRDYLQRACDILLEILSPERICGCVENIDREGTLTQICTLGELRQMQVNMFTTVYIGNSQTRRIGNKMVTPRGYQVGTKDAGNRDIK